MLRWLPPLLACLAQRVTALAVPTSPEHLAVLEAGGRTAPRYGRSFTAEISSLGEVGLLLHQHPVVTGSKGLSVYGNLMLLTVNPMFFTADDTVLAASGRAIEHVAKWPGAEATALSVTRARISLTIPEEFPTAVRVGFEVAFGSLSHRQTFIRDILADGGRMIAGNISQQVPFPFTGRCSLFLRDDESLLETKVAIMGFTERKCFGNFSFPAKNATAWASSTNLQDVTALAIAEVSGVSPLEIGLLIAPNPSSSSVLVSYWVTSSDRSSCQDAVQRVQQEQDSMKSHIDEQRERWSVRNKASPPHAVNGRIVFKVPVALPAMSNGALQQAVRDVIAQTASPKAPKATNLSASSANVTLATVVAERDVVRVFFQVVFQDFKNAQVFISDLAWDGGETLVRNISKRAPRLFNGNCTLFGGRRFQAARKDLGPVFFNWQVEAQSPQLAAMDAKVQDVMAVTVARLAGVSTSEVGILMVGRVSQLPCISVTVWVTSANLTFRQVAAGRLLNVTARMLARGTLVTLNRLDLQTPSNATELTYGNFWLNVSSNSRFSETGAVRDGVRKAIAELAAVPAAQVALNVTDPSPGLKGRRRLVLVDFQVTFTARAANQALATKMAVDDGQLFLETIRRHVELCRGAGSCGIPGVNRTQAPMTLGNGTTPSRTSTVARSMAKPYGTVSFYTFEARSFARDSALRANALWRMGRLASVPGTQVGVMITAQSASVVRMDFWFFSAKTTPRKVANNWNNRAALTFCAGAMAI